MEQWFKGGITNICYNCIDRNVEDGLGDKIAMYWEGNEPAFDASLTYTHLLHQVSQVIIYLFIYYYYHFFSYILIKQIKGTLRKKIVK